MQPRNKEENIEYIIGYLCPRAYLDICFLWMCKLSVIFESLKALGISTRSFVRFEDKYYLLLMQKLKLT